VVPRMPCARVGHSAVALRGRLYALGGFDGFFLLPSMHSIILPPRPLDASHALVVNRRVPAFPAPTNSQAQEQTEMLDDDEDVGGEEEARGQVAWEGGEWEKEADMLEARNGFGACVVRDQIWAAGGNKGFQCLASVETFLPDRYVYLFCTLHGVCVSVCVCVCVCMCVCVFVLCHVCICI
jgi:hypothetical protein